MQYNKECTLVKRILLYTVKFHSLVFYIYVYYNVLHRYGTY